MPCPYCTAPITTEMRRRTTLAQPAWQGRPTARDLRALTPLTWLHINPDGTCALDMRQRLPLDLAA